VIAFLDANALIYLIEGAQPFAGRVRDALKDSATSHPNLQLAVSRLTWLECHVKPMRDNNRPALAAYAAFFARPDLIWIDLNQDVVELATVIRVQHALRTPDSLQAASCLQLGADHLFFTGDAGFEKVAGLNVNLVS